MSEIIIKEIDGADVVQYQPRGVCRQIRIKDNIVQDFEFMGGCNGNLTGIGMLIRGMNINDVISRLQGLPCGSRPTSCPDQLTKALAAYIKEKQTVNA